MSATTRSLTTPASRRRLTGAALGRLGEAPLGGGNPPAADDLLALVLVEAHGKRAGTL